MRSRCLIRFSIEGDLRFISHHDTLRLFERALARADWPVKFSEGFNPRPRLSLPLPRSVGIASEDELLVVELAQELDPNEAVRELSRHLPCGLQIHGAAAFTASGNPQPQCVVYELRIPATRELADAAEAFLRRHR